MTCPVSSPIITKILTQIFGIPAQVGGRIVADETFQISAIVLHCYSGTIAQLDNKLRCAIIKGIATDTTENSYHYGIGVNNSIRQYVDDADISWAFGAYRSNSYATVPPPSESIDWPTLQALYPGNVTPDTYVLNIALALGDQINIGDCPDCPTSSGLPKSQHEQLVQLIAYLTEQYTIPITSDYITFHDFICCDDMDNKCLCTDLDTLITEVIDYCPPCPDGSERPDSLPEADASDVITHFIGVTEPCCLGSNGCMVDIPFNNCFLGDLVQIGDIDDPAHFVGLELNQITGQLCLVSDNINVAAPLTGDGIDASPFTIDRCTLETWLNSFAPLDQIERLMGVDTTGCWTLENNDTWFDRIVCAQPENAGSTPTWVLVKGDICPEWVTPTQIVDAGISVIDTDCIGLTWTGTTLFADPIIAPTQSNIPNVLSCVVNEGLYVPQILPIAGDCVAVVDNGDGTYSINLTVAPAQSGVNNVLDCVIGQGAFSPEYLFVDGNTVNFITSGSFNSNITAEVILDPDPTNTLTSSVSGLLNPPLNIDNINSDCLSLSVDINTNTLSVDLVISPDANNILECLGNGAYVGFNILNTPCIELSFVAGILSATPVISGSIGGIQNVTICDLSNGFYTPRGANAFVSTPITGNGSDLSPLDIDFTTLDANDLCDLGAAIPIGTLTDIVGLDAAGCLRVATGEEVIGQYLIVQDTNCINLSLIGNVLSAEPIISGTAGNKLQCLGGGQPGLYVSSAEDLIVDDTDCIQLTLVGNLLTADILLDAALDNWLTCELGGLYVQADLCDLGTKIIAETIDTADPDGFVILDPDTDCLTHGDRLHNLSAATLPVGGFAQGYTIGSKWIVPPFAINVNQTREMRYIMVKDGVWHKIQGGTQIGTGAQPSVDVVPAATQFVPDLTASLFDVLGELDLINDWMLSLDGGNQQTHVAAQMDFPTPPAGDLVVKIGIIINGVPSIFDPIIVRHYGFTGGETINVTGTTQGYSVVAGDTVEVYIDHNAGGNANLTSWVVNHYGLINF